MAAAPAHVHPHRHAPLVRQDRLHEGGFADDAQVRAQPALVQVLHQPACAEAPDLLVVAQQQVDRAAQPGGLQGGHGGQHGGDEALHVRGAAPVQAAVVAHEGERVGGPGLAVHRDRVHVAGQGDAAGRLRPDGGMQVGFLARRIQADPVGHAQAVQVGADPSDQRQVGVAAGGVEADQRRQDVGRGQCHRRTLQALRGAATARRPDGPGFATRQGLAEPGAVLYAGAIAKRKRRHRFEHVPIPPDCQPGPCAPAAACPAGRALVRVAAAGGRAGSKPRPVALSKIMAQRAGPVLYQGPTPPVAGAVRQCKPPLRRGNPRAARPRAAGPGAAMTALAVLDCCGAAPPAMTGAQRRTIRQPVSGFVGAQTCSGLLGIG